MGQNQSVSARGGRPVDCAAGGIHVVRPGGTSSRTNTDTHGDDDLLVASRETPLPAPLLPPSAAPENVASALAGPDMFHELRTAFGGIVSGAVSAVTTSASAVPGVLAGIGAIGSGNARAPGLSHSSDATQSPNTGHGLIESLVRADIPDSSPGNSTGEVSARASAADNSHPGPSHDGLAAIDHRCLPVADDSVHSQVSSVLDRNSAHDRSQEAEHHVDVAGKPSISCRDSQESDDIEHLFPALTQSVVDQTFVTSCEVRDRSGEYDGQGIQGMWARLALDGSAMKHFTDEASGGEPLRLALVEQEKLIRMVGLAKQSAERLRAAMDATENEARRTKKALERLERLRMATAEVQDLLESAAATANIIGAAHFPDDDEMYSFSAYLRHHPPVYPKTFNS
jgi:hypothetical protein